MIMANEAMEMAKISVENKILQSKLIAQDTIGAIEAIIKCDAQEGKFSSVFHLYNYHNFISDYEKKAYRNELIEILKTNGYMVKYEYSKELLEIRFY